ncbi:MAG: hypothetical protein J6W93_00990 [Clostridia bacterium]|nr:hypothetical protein [Clostridia bacterium]
MQEQHKTVSFWPRLKELVKGRLFTVTIAVFAFVSAASIAYDVTALGPLYAISGLPAVLEVVFLLMFRSACLAEDEPPRTSGLTAVYVTQIVVGALTTVALAAAGIVLAAMSEESFAELLQEISLNKVLNLSEYLNSMQSYVSAADFKIYVAVVIFGTAALSALYYALTAIGTKRVRDAVRDGVSRKPVPAGLITILALIAVVQVISVFGASSFLVAIVSALEATKAGLFAFCGYKFNTEFPAVPI